MASGVAYPTTLIIAQSRDENTQSSSSNQSDAIPNTTHGQFSGSGFLVNARHGILATSTTWLHSALHITLKRGSSAIYSRNTENTEMGVTSGGLSNNTVAIATKRKSGVPSLIEWKLKQPLHFQVLMQDQLSPEGNGVNGAAAVNCYEASLLGVYLMPAVYSGLKGQLSSLSHWRRSIQQENGETSSMEDSDLHTALLPLSCLALLKIHSYRKLNFSLLPFSQRKVCVGEPVRVVGTPFGSFCPEVFLGCVWEGCVCKSVGREGVVFVTDAGSQPGCEGALVTQTLSPSSESVVGMVLAPLSTQGGSPAGLSLACSAGAMLQTLHLSLPQLATDICIQDSSAGVQLPASLLTVTLPVTVAITAGSLWGSGVLVTADLILTCGHVIQELKAPIVVKLPSPVFPKECEARVVVSNSTPDFGILELRRPLSNQGAVENTCQCVERKLDSMTMTSTAKITPMQGNVLLREVIDELREGMPIFVIGYGLQDPTKNSPHVCLEPLMTRGVIAKVVRWRKQAVMLVTTALVHSGMSGGVVVSAVTGRPVGMVVSNSQDVETSSVYPNVNYCLPFSWIVPPVLEFCQTRDLSCLRELQDCPSEVAEIWRLSSRFVKEQRMVQSKL